MSLADAIAEEIERAATPEPGSPATLPAGTILRASLSALVVGSLITGGALWLILWVWGMIT